MGSGSVRGGWCTKCGHRDLLGGQKYLVGGLEDGLVCVLRKRHIADMSPHRDWELLGPQGQHMGRAAAPLELSGLLADVIYQLRPQL